MTTTHLATALVLTTNSRVTTISPVTGIVFAAVLILLLLCSGLFAPFDAQVLRVRDNLEPIITKCWKDALLP